MRAEDIEKLVSVARPTIAPDGSFAVFATSRPDLAANRAVGQLWRVDLPDGTPRRLTRGTADAAPRLSPDGLRIAFLRGDAKDKSQLFVVDAAGGEPVQATDAPLGVGDFDWAPDGSALAFTARVPEPGRYGSVEGLEGACRGAPPHHRHPLARQRPRLPCRSTVPAVRRRGSRHGCRALLRAGARGAARRRDTAQEEGRRA